MERGRASASFASVSILLLMIPCSSSGPAASPTRMEESANANGNNSNVRVREASPSTASSHEPVVPSTSSTVTHHRNASDYSEIREEAWSCVVVLLTFWFFAASMTLILGFYGSLDLSLGPNSSCLLRANSFFVQEIKVKADDTHGPMLYGFSSPPLMNVEASWSQVFDEHIPSNVHKEWVYQLNEGSEINISYTVFGSSPVTLVIAEGRENFVEWVDDPSYPNTTLSWNMVQGNGSIHQKIFRESEYYVAVGNLLPDVVEVKLELGIHALLYNTTGAYYQCELKNGLCVLKLFVFRSNAAILATPSPKMVGAEIDNWYLKVSYGPRWITYFIGSGALTIIVLLVFKFMSNLRSRGNRTDHQSETLAPERTPLIPDRDDLLSCGSSYDSASNDEEGHGDEVSGSGSAGTRSPKEYETDGQHRLCVICFDSPRDSFFLPCGHCAACFACGMRIAEELGNCPICSRKMKKVKKIFTV